MKTTKSLLLCLISLCVLIIPIGRAEATSLVGGTTDYFHSFDGSLDSVAIDLTSLGFGVVQTGPISFYLNPLNPATQLYTFNFDTMTATQDFDLFIKFPLLQTLGESPLKIHISEAGPILGVKPDLPEGNNQLLTFQSQLIGGGIVEPGSIFSGSEYSNFNDNVTNKTVNVGPGGTYNQTIQGGGNVNVKVGATINVKVNGQQVGLVNTQGTGTANIATTPLPIPIPSTLLLISSGLVGLVGFGRKSLFKTTY